MERQLLIGGSRSSLLIGGFVCVLLWSAPVYSQEVLVPPDAELRFFRGREEPPPNRLNLKTPRKI